MARRWRDAAAMMARCWRMLARQWRDDGARMAREGGNDDDVATRTATIPEPPKVLN